MVKCWPYVGPMSVRRRPHAILTSAQHWLCIGWTANITLGKCWQLTSGRRRPDARRRPDVGPMSRMTSARRRLPTSARRSSRSKANAYPTSNCWWGWWCMWMWLPSVDTAIDLHCCFAHAENFYLKLGGRKEANCQLRGSSETHTRHPSKLSSYNFLSTSKTGLLLFPDFLLNSYKWSVIILARKGTLFGWTFTHV